MSNGRRNWKNIRFHIKYPIYQSEWRENGDGRVKLVGDKSELHSHVWQLFIGILNGTLCLMGRLFFTRHITSHRLALVTKIVNKFFRTFECFKSDARLKVEEKSWENNNCNNSYPHSFMNRKGLVRFEDISRFSKLWWKTTEMENSLIINLWNTTV